MGNKLTFLYTSPYEHLQYKYIVVVKSLKGLVGIMLARVNQHYFTIGPMYRVMRLMAFRGIKRHPYG